MQWTERFIRRPVLSSVLGCLILFLGILGYQRLEIREFPNVQATVINVGTLYPGASADKVEYWVTNPLETRLSGLKGVDYVSSSSQENYSNINVRFALGADIDTAVSEITSKVGSAKWQLPEEAHDPVVSKADPNAQPTMYIALNSDQINPTALSDYYKRVMLPQMQNLPGVNKADLLGGSYYAMRVWLDPYKMKAFGVTPVDVYSAMQRENIYPPAGQLKTNQQTFSIYIDNPFKNARDFNELMIAERGHQIIRMKDIGEVKLGVRSDDVSVNINGKPSVIIAITPNSDANPIEVSKVVRAALDEMNQRLPQGIHAEINWDTSVFISRSIEEVKSTIFKTAGFVIIVILLFLGSLRVVSIPALTIPLSLVGSFFLISAAGFTLNTLTLLALVLAIGMVVDDAIVVAENIHRHIEEGLSPLEASITGVKEIQFAVIAMTLTLAAVYTPIAWIGGVTGALFQEFAYALVAAILLSGLIALTMTPMMCAKIMNKRSLEGRFATMIFKASQRLATSYQRLLTWVLNYKKWVALLAAGLLAGVFTLAQSFPNELAPQEDAGAVLTFIKGPVATNRHYLKHAIDQIEKIYKAVPEETGYGIITGYPSSNQALSFLILKPWDERARTVDEVMGSLFPQFMGLSSVQAFPINPYSLPGASGGMPFNLVLKANGDIMDLAADTDRLASALKKTPGFVNVGSSVEVNEPQIHIDIDQRKANDLGISPRQISQAIYVALGEPTDNHFIYKGRSYAVIPKLKAPFSESIQGLKALSVRSATGAMIPLARVVHISKQTGVQAFSHFQGQRSATISASLLPTLSLDAAIQKAKILAQQVLPSSVSVDFSGTSRQFIQSQGKNGVLYAYALIFIFLILAIQFESYSKPMIILTSVPLSLFGALLALKAIGGSLNIYTNIGMVTLIGLISKHGILLVELANQRLEQGASVIEAAVHSAGIRLRPILITTAAMVLGALPLALSTGVGAIARNQMGWIIVGGMTLGTLFTLFVVPCIYALFVRQK